VSANDIDPEDAKLFREQVGEVTPLKKTASVQHEVDKPRPKRQESPTDLKEFHRPELEYQIPNVEFGEQLAYLAEGISKKILRDLRRGKFDIEAELDMHGMTTLKAKQALLRLLKICRQDRLRCVHIIHGNGFRSEGQMPVLKSKLNHWLQQSPDVLAFCSARDKDGGSGAVYVLLKYR